MNKRVIISSFFIFIIILCFLYIYITNSESFKNDVIVLSPALSDNDIIDLHKGQNIMTDMFNIFDKLCRKHNLKYWCLGGTLIGAIRHKGWIPWDGDLDVGMLYDDYNKMKVIIKDELPDNLIFMDKTTHLSFGKIRDLCSHYKYSKEGMNWDTNDGLQLDIFIFKEKNKDNGNKDVKVLYGTHPVGGSPDNSIRDYDDVFPLKEMSFENLTVYVPNKYNKISKEIWGDEIPKLLPIDKRFPHEGRMNPNKPSLMMKEKYKEKYIKNNICNN